MPRARRFYEQLLGFKPAEEFADGGVAYEAGGTQFLVTPTSGKPCGQHPQIAFLVGDIRTEIGELLRIGVEVEENDGTVWFKDSEGNVISLVDAPGTSPSP